MRGVRNVCIGYARLFHMYCIGLRCIGDDDVDGEIDTDGDDRAPPIVCCAQPPVPRCCRLLRARCPHAVSGGALVEELTHHALDLGATLRGLRDSDRFYW